MKKINFELLVLVLLSLFALNLNAADVDRNAPPLEWLSGDEMQVSACEFINLEGTTRQSCDSDQGNSKISVGDKIKFVWTGKEVTILVNGSAGLHYYDGSSQVKVTYDLNSANMAGPGHLYEALYSLYDKHSNSRNYWTQSLWRSDKNPDLIVWHSSLEFTGYAFGSFYARTVWIRPISH